MSDPSPSSLFRAQFESALRDYQEQTGTFLASHPLTGQLQRCGSVESITAVLQDQARALIELRGGDGRIMRSLRSIVSVLYALGAGITLGESIGLVRRDVRLGVLRL